MKLAYLWDFTYYKFEADKSFKAWPKHNFVTSKSETSLTQRGINKINGQSNSPEEAQLMSKVLELSNYHKQLLYVSQEVLTDKKRMLLKLKRRVIIKKWCFPNILKYCKIHKKETLEILRSTSEISLKLCSYKLNLQWGLLTFK